MRVEVLQEVPGDVVGEFYGLYRAALEPLRTLAAARHVLTAAEFASAQDRTVRDRSRARAVSSSTPSCRYGSVGSAGSCHTRSCRVTGRITASSVGRSRSNDGR